MHEGNPFCEVCESHDPTTEGLCDSALIQL